MDNFEWSMAILRNLWHFKERIPMMISPGNRERRGEQPSTPSAFPLPSPPLGCQVWLAKRCEWALRRRMPLRWLRRWKVASWRLGSAKAVSDRWGLMLGPLVAHDPHVSPTPLSPSLPPSLPRRLPLVPPPLTDPYRTPHHRPPVGLVSFQRCRWRGILLNLINYRTSARYIQGVTELACLTASLKIGYQSSPDKVSTYRVGQGGRA